MSVAVLQVWFGPPPEWIDRYRERVAAQTGFDFIFFHDEAEFRRRVRERLGIEAPAGMVESGKIHDFRPAFGVLFAEEIGDHEFWAHTDMDCVYGRLDAFYGPPRLDAIDVLSDHWEYLCGPWTVYRNTPEVNRVYLDAPDWCESMLDPEDLGWVEFTFTEAMNNSGLRVEYDLKHAWRDPAGLVLTDGRLTHFGQEIPFFHFRHTKRWPL